MRPAFLFLALVPLLAAPPSTTKHKGPDPLDPTRLDAMHAQRIQWMQKRQPPPPQVGIYRDFRMISAPHREYSEAILEAAKDTKTNIVWLSPGSKRRTADGILFLDSATNKIELPHFDEAAEGLQSGVTPKELRRAEVEFKLYPNEVFAVAGESWLTGLKGLALEESFNLARFNHASTHVLARELNEAEIRQSLAGGHFYLAHDWLCDPTGFTFVANNYFGSFEMGDEMPMLGPITGEANIEIQLPIKAKVKLYRDEKVVAEVEDSKLHYVSGDAGTYRLEAVLSIDGRDVPWIKSNSIFVGSGSGLALPNLDISPGVEVHKDITYTGGAPEDANKHKLDLYLPKGKQNFPVMVFFHGGSWKSGDRSIYVSFGDRFAKAGIGVVIPSYRLMPKNPHPAQMEDAAAAFAWAYKNMEAYGGDMKRVYVAGHSSGGHMASLLALDPRYLRKFGVPMESIRGVLAMSGVYDLTDVPQFDVGKGADPSPIHYLRPGAPPFLVTYAQWDYYTLPKQARDFEAALKKNFIDSKMVYIPGQSHISEMVNIWKDGDPLAQAVLNFVDASRPATEAKRP